MNHRQVREIIKKCRRILIATHMNPDFDAICSELAMAEYLKVQKKEFMIVHEKMLAPMYHILKGHHHIKTLSMAKGTWDLAIILDCGDKDRIGAVKEFLSSEVPIVNIDHHFTNVRFGKVNCVHPGASSTAEILFEMFKAFNMKLSKTIAQLLYIGILTDTGSFRYQNTTARTHQIVSELLTFGILPASVYRQIYEDLKSKDFKLLLSVAGRAQYLADGKVVSLCLSEKILDQAGGAFDLKDKLFSLFRMVKSIQVIVLFSKITLNKTRINFRSTGSANVAAIAKVFGGGGHKAASGCILERDIEQAQKMVLKEILKKVQDC